MSEAWLNEIQQQFVAAGIETVDHHPARLLPARQLEIAPHAWAPATALCRQCAMRWAAFWVREAGSGLEAFSCLEKGGGYLILSTRLGEQQALESIAHLYPAADRPQRHAHDLFGIAFEGQCDSRRWTRHQAWREDEFPLRGDGQATEPPAATPAPTPADDSYPFVQASGSAVYEIAVGPVHAGIIEPGHFRFQAVGETVINLEKHLGYVHKGIEKLARGRDLEGLARLAGRVSGDSTVAHGWAACQAAERALGVEPPPRAQLLRAIMAERERVANHLGDIGAICNDVGFAFPHYQLSRLKERLVRDNALLFGHRLMMDRVVPGGVAIDIDSQGADHLFACTQELEAEVAKLIEIIERSESLEDRLMTTGRLTPEWAAELGCLGYVGRASGCDFDVRRDAPYAPYHRVEVAVPGYRAGDVAARAKIRADEIGVSLGLMRRFVELLEPGEHRLPMPQGRGGEGLGIVDGWRGEIISYLALDADGRVERFFPRDPSWLNWPALEQLIQGNIVPDFPVCNKSINGSYSGQDL
jgi:Ni,Fe-hydrogenase III large subunit